MANDQRLEVLLQRWEALAQQGQDVTAEYLASADPELAAELARRILARKQAAGRNLGQGGPPEGAAGRAGDGQPVTLATALVAGVGAEPLPGYRLIQRLGGGGFGQVWEAEGPQGSRCAVKIIPGCATAGGQDRASVELDGLQRIMGIDNPWKLWIHRYELVGTTLVIVSDLAEGTLGEFLQGLGQAPGSPAVVVECLHLLRGVAAFLDVLNLEFDLVHGDIKPNNLLQSGGQCLVADFGTVVPLGLRPSGRGLTLCVPAVTDPDRIETIPYRSPRQVPWGQVDPRRASLVTRCGCFTPHYAPPEAFAARVSRSFDQYSLALVFSELAFGQEPFRGTLDEQLAQRSRGEFALALLPEGLRPIIARALAPDPGRRFATCGAFLDRLRDAFRPLAGAAGTSGALLDW